MIFEDLEVFDIVVRLCVTLCHRAFLRILVKSAIGTVVTVDNLVVAVPVMRSLIVIRSDSLLTVSCDCVSNPVATASGSAAGCKLNLQGSNLRRRLAVMARKRRPHGLSAPGMSR